MHLSGASISFLNLLKGMKEKGNEMLVIAPNYESSGTQVSYKFVSILISMSIPYMQIPLQWDIKYDFSFKGRVKSIVKRAILLFLNRKSKYVYNREYSKKILREIIEEFSPDIVHTNLGVIHVGFEVCQELGIPHVWHLRDYHDLDFHWQPLPSWNSFKSQLKESDYVITITNDIKRHFDLWDSPNTVTIYNGCFDAKDVAMDFPKEKYFFCASRLIETKGHDDVVKAFDLFYQKYPDYQLILAGIGEEKYIFHLNELIQSLSCRKAIKLIGHQNDVRPLMRKAKALIVGSFNEGFGRMTAEAAFCGCLVIGRNTGGTKEILDQIGGFPFDNENAVNGIFERMKQVVNLSDNQYHQLAEKAQNKAVSLYSNESYVEQVYAVYLDLLKK